MKSLLADVLFFTGNKFIELSARLCGYDDIASEISKNRVNAWRKRSRKEG